MLSKLGNFRIDFRRMEILTINNDINIHEKRGSEIEEQFPGFNSIFKFNFPTTYSKEFYKLMDILNNYIPKFRLIGFMGIYQGKSSMSHAENLSYIPKSRDFRSGPMAKIEEYLEKSNVVHEQPIRDFIDYVDNVITYIPYSPENEILVNKILARRETDEEFMQFIKIFLYENDSSAKKKINIGEIFYDLFNSYNSENNKFYKEKEQDFEKEYFGKLMKRFKEKVSLYMILILGYRFLMFMYEH